jgi:membrane protein
MDKIQSLVKNLDRIQQSNRFLAFPVAVIKRYMDDRVGKQAALVTYYTFLSLFPLLLIFITIIGILITNNIKLENQIMQSVYQLFPALGDDLQKNVKSLHTSGLALFLQSLVFLYGARGLASILQETFNNIWHIEHEHRPGFWDDHLRSFMMMLAVGLGMTIGAGVSLLLSSIFKVGWMSAILITVVNIGVTFWLFLSVFRLGTSEKISTHKLMLGAFIATLGVLLVQRLGGIIMSHELQRLQGLYGSFALALGMLFWIYLQAQVILYAIVITIVRTERDYPKKLF